MTMMLQQTGCRLGLMLSGMICLTLGSGAGATLAISAKPHMMTVPRLIAIGPQPLTLAATDPQLAPDLKAILAGGTIQGVVTSKTPSAIRLSIPSLWWVSDQLADLQPFGKKFIQEWIAYPLRSGQPGRVDLLVNRQQWSLLDYFQRYQFVNKFSTIARSFGYNTRVYDNPDRPPVALYTCDFTAEAVTILKAPPPAPTSVQMTNRNTAVRADLANQPSCSLQMRGMANFLRRPSQSPAPVSP